MMQNWLNDPTFIVYTITCLTLCANLLFLWGYSGGVRSKSKIVINPEDAGSVAKGATVAPTDPPEVARVLRAHANAMANIVPFLVLGLLYVLAGGPPGPAKVIFGVFTGARLLHSAVYLGGKQPWRTLSFIVGALATLALMGDLVWMLVR